VPAEKRLAKGRKSMKTEMGNDYSSVEKEIKDDDLLVTK
jgi:hypothetical protein